MAKKVISDQEGQRRFPGKVTKIRGNTMSTEGYGNIPLWVVPDKGESRMVYPNTGDHYFPEASFFTEYPRMQAGGAESTGVYIRPDKLNLNKEVLPKKIKGLSVVDKKRQVAELNRQLEERDQAMYIHGLENPGNVNKFASVLDPTGGLDINSIVESVIRTGTMNPSDLAGAAASIVPYGGKYIFKPAAKKLLLNAVSKQGDIEDFTNNQYKKGGPMKTPSNKGFEHLPKYVQKHIIANMKQKGGQKNYSLHNFSKSSDPSVENYSSGNNTFFRMPRTDVNNSLPAVVNNIPTNFYPGFKEAGMNSMVPAPVDHQSGNAYYYQFGGPMLPQDALVMGEDLPVLQAGGGLPQQRIIDRSQYTKQFNSWNTNKGSSAAGNNVYGNAEDLKDPNYEANFHGQMTQLGYKRNNSVDKFPVYTKDGSTLIRHPSGAGYVDVGKFQDLKFNTPTLPVTQQPVQAAPLNQPVTPQPMRQPLNFNSPSGVYDSNSGTMYTGEPGASATKIIPPIIQDFGTTQSKMKRGGENPFNKNIVSKFLDSYNKKFGGSKAPQGESLDEVLQKKNIEFVNYIANNTKAALFKEEALNFQNDKAQFGKNVTSQFGPYVDSSVPDYVSSMQAPYKEQFPVVDSNYGTPSNLNLNPNGDFSGTNPVNTRNNSNYSNEIADFGMSAVQGVNSFFNLMQANKQKQFNQNKMTIENTVPTTYGNRGLYDVNQGNFKLNQKTPYFKKGGTYKNLDHQTIRDLLAQGYELEFLD